VLSNIETDDYCDKNVGSIARIEGSTVMTFAAHRTGFPCGAIRNVIVILCTLMLIPGDLGLMAMPTPQAEAPSNEAAAKIPPEQLDSLVAPVALYPDPLLAQVLAASTYPLEIIQLQQWLGQNKNLKDQALVDAVKKQGWDPSIQAMAALPDVVKRLADDIKWTTDLGNAFLAQQSDVMDAVQRMRKKAKDKGLKSNEQMKVETQTVENKQVIVIQQASPQVIQVPSYDPVVVYGPPPYPYPPIYYPPPPPSGWAVAGGMALSFGIGVAMGAAWGGGWGWGCGWGHNDVNVNVNNNFNRNTNISNSGNRVNAQGGNRNTFQHNPQHRGGTPYGDRNTANKFGGTTRGDSLSNRQASARRNQSQVGDRQRNGGNDRGSGGRGDLGDRSSGGRQQAGVSDRSAGGRDDGGRGSRDGVSDRSSGGGGGGDRVGNRSTSGGGGSRGSSAFGGSGSGSSARSSSSRGSSSMGGGGGRSRSGGGGGRRR